KELTSEQRQVLSSVLAGLYKIAGVDLVREQLTASVSPHVPAWYITDHCLVIRDDPLNGHSIAYDLRESHDLLLHQHHNGDLVTPDVNVDGKSLFFSRVPLTWEQWVECWQRDADGKGHPKLLPETLPL